MTIKMPILKSFGVGLFGLIGTLEVWFPISFNADSDSWLSDPEGALIVVGFFMFFFSLAWFVSLWVEVFRPESTKEDSLRWEQKRIFGRAKYISRFVAVWSVASVTAVLLNATHQLRESEFAKETIVFVSFLVLIVFLAVVGAGRAFWDYQERNMFE